MQVATSVSAAGLPGKTSRGLGFQKLDRPLEDRDLDAEILSEKPSPIITLPPVEPAHSEDQSLAGQTRVYVRSFKIEGNTVLSPDDISEIDSPYVGRFNTSDENDCCLK